MDSEKPSDLARRGMGRVHFLALLPAIREALDQGWPMKSVFERHREALRMSYPQFTRYVGRYVTGTIPARRKNQPARPRSAPAATDGKVEPKGFHYNPIPRKEDLI